MTEYRLEQLAVSAGTTVRNIRAYRDRGLLPAPRREGRVALYSDAHLGRLRLIADLLDRGYTLQSIGELLAAWERGKDIGDVLGLEEVLSTPWSDERPETMDRETLERVAGTPMSDDDLALAQQIGLLEALPADDPGGETRYLVHSVSQLAATGKLVAEGMPTDVVFESARQLHELMDRIAAGFVDLFGRYIVDPVGDDPTSEELEALTTSVENLRPVASTVVNAELSRAMARHTQRAVEAWLDRAAAPSS